MEELEGFQPRESGGNGKVRNSILIVLVRYNRPSHKYCFDKSNRNRDVEVLNVLSRLIRATRK